MPTKLKALPHEQTNGYVSLAELTKIKPPERDLEVDGRKYRIRGLMSGEVHRVSSMANPPGLPSRYDGHLDSVLTVCFGLVRPTVYFEDIEAARLVVDGLPDGLRVHLAEAIVELTRGIVAPDDQEDADTAEVTDADITSEDAAPTASDA